jgi:prepilin-type N-terminal cleavage/methylation domain-containing protein
MMPSSSSSSTRVTRRQRLRARGYTAIEVLMAMTVFAVGAAGVIAMQRASIQGNADARKLDVANSIARDWLERLRRDATMWTQPGILTQTQYLSQTATYYGNWALPEVACPAATSGSNSNADGLCPAFDIFGRDLAQDHYVDAQFCANIRLDNASTGNPDLIRAEVRVYWPRLLPQALTAPYSGAHGFCDAAGITASNGPDGASGGPNVYHFVYASTMLRMSPL